MLETDLVLDFCCPHCYYPVAVKLKCCGKGVAAGPHAAADVPIPCPTCHTTSKVYFELSGLILAIKPMQKSTIREPSLN